MSKKSGYNKLKNNENTKSKPRVLYIWSIPANGHLNPTLCLTNSLLLKLDEMKIDKIVFYCGPSFESLILNLPNNVGKNLIEFRDYRLEKYTGSENLLKTFMNFDTRPGTLFRMFHIFENSLKLGSKHIFKNLLADMHKDKPVLILYDQALFFPKLALNLYEKKYKCPKPIHVSYVTTFLCARGVYPTWSEMDKMGLLGNNTSIVSRVNNHIITFVDFMSYLFSYYKVLWWDLGFSIADLALRCDWPLGRDHLIDEGLNLVFVIPQIQPRLDQFKSSNIQFVGSCIDEEVRSKILAAKFDVNMSKYTQVIENFLEKNLVNGSSSSDITNASKGIEIQPSSSGPSLFLRSDSTGHNFKRRHKPIIYVSMGTVFNNENSDIFEILVEACKYFSNEYAIIVSTGDEKTYKRYANTSVDGENILLVPHTPQVEILKRSHLFITHAGMNSVSEAILYGVPIITLPLSGDQPFVAWRQCDELNMGIRLQPDSTLTVKQVREAISQVLNNPIYRETATQLSEHARTYQGHKIAADLLADYVNECEQELNCVSRV